MLTKGVIGLALMVFSAQAIGPSIAVGNWYAMTWANGVGSTLTDGGGYTGTQGTVLLDPGASPWTFSGPATLVVTDMFIDGDQFQVFDNGVSIGTTSVPVNDGTACGNDPLGCTGNDWSHGTFVLGSGNHSITMTLVAAATGYISGGAAFELTTAAPTPTPGPPTFGLVILGCVGLALGRWLFRLQRETVRLS
ncbi:MAG: hypothetical protein WBL61_03550 [Bryobacteraceae bacterium]